MGQILQQPEGFLATGSEVNALQFAADLLRKLKGSYIFREYFNVFRSNKLLTNDQNGNIEGIMLDIMVT
jgi:hypothetical protein